MNLKPVPTASAQEGSPSGKHTSWPAPLAALCLFWARLSVSSPGPNGLRSPLLLFLVAASPPPLSRVLAAVTHRGSWPLTNKKTIFLSNSTMLRIALAR